MSLAIGRLDLVRWGNFTDRSLRFDGGPGAVELIYGPNAAGKSTIARAQIALLYGIPARTADNHTHPYQDLAIGAELLLDGASVELTRRKANVGSLRAADGTTLRDDPIPSALGGMGHEIYASLFHVDNDTLVRGGEDLLQGKGEIGASLFAAAAGISALHRHVAAFEQQAGDIFRPRASSTLLLQELARLRDRERQLHSTLVRPAAHKRLVAELKDLQQQADEVAKRIAALFRERGDLERLVEVIPLIARRRRLIAQRAELGDVPELAADARERRAAAQATIASERAQRDRHLAENDRLAAQRDALDLDPALLARAADIRLIVEQIPVVQKADSDRRRLVVELGQAREDLDVAAEAIGVPAETLGGLRRPEAARRQLDQVLEERGRLCERVDAAVERHRAAAARHAEISHEPASSTAPVDLSALDAAVRAARPRIGLDDQLAEARRLHARRTQDAERSLAALTPAPGTIAELLALPPLPQDTVSGLQARAAQQREEEIQLDADQRQLDEQRADHAGLAEELRQLGRVVTPVLVHEARQRRDERWRGLRETMRAGEAPTAGVLDSYETSVASADENADELARGATAAETARREAADARRLATREAQLDERRQAIEKRSAELAAEWAGVWAATGLAPVDLDRARDWQRACQDAQAAARAAVDAEDQAGALAEQLARARAALRGHLGGHLTDIPEDAPVADLVALAEGLIERNAKLVSAADERRRELGLAGKERGRANGALDEAKRSWEAWTSAWPDRCRAAGLPENTEPEQAHELARIVTEGLAAQRQIDQLQARVDGIDRDREQLQYQLRQLLDELAPDLNGREAWQAAAVLTERLTEQESRHSKHAELTERLRETNAAAASAQQACSKAQDEIDELCRDAGCETADELPAIEDRCKAAADLDRQIQDLEDRIVERGRDSLANLTERTADVDPDETVLKIGHLSEEREGLEEQRAGLLEQVGQARLRLTDAEGDDRAVEAAQEIEFSQARLVDLARKYAVARLSGAVIRRAIDRYRDHNQHPMVLRANVLFGRFTEGTYAELFVDADERGRGYLVARSNNGAIHTMEQMSKGTREQLFLALRIAAIERYVQQSGPVPVMFDDVFVESDEDRSAQIFAALGELAKQTQVIVLTHHRHLIAIAQKALGPQLRAQELPAARAGLRAAA